MEVDSEVMEELHYPTDQKIIALIEALDETQDTVRLASSIKTVMSLQYFSQQQKF